MEDKILNNEYEDIVDEKEKTDDDLDVCDCGECEECIEKYGECTCGDCDICKKREAEEEIDVEDLYDDLEPEDMM